MMCYNFVLDMSVFILITRPGYLVEATRYDQFTSHPLTPPLPNNALLGLHYMGQLSILDTPTMTMTMTTATDIWTYRAGQVANNWKVLSAY